MSRILEGDPLTTLQNHVFAPSDSRTREELYSRDEAQDLSKKELPIGSPYANQMRPLKFLLRHVPQLHAAFWHGRSEPVKALRCAPTAARRLRRP